MSTFQFSNHKLPLKKIRQFRNSLISGSLKSPLWLLPVLGTIVAANPAQAQEFDVREQRAITGDIEIIGNTLLTCPLGQPGINPNDTPLGDNPDCETARNRNTGAGGTNFNFNMVYVDEDNDATTFNSSRATLDLPEGAAVVWAGLYWSGRSNAANRNTVKFRKNGGGYETVSSVSLNTFPDSNFYQGFAEVTGQVNPNSDDPENLSEPGSGDYWVADVQSDTGSNQYAAWSLVVIYRDPARNFRLLTVFDPGNTNLPLVIGFNPNDPDLGTPQLSIPISGFVTPPADPFDIDLGMVVYEGDAGITSDRVFLEGQQLSNEFSRPNDIFNNTIDNFIQSPPPENSRNPFFPNQLGFDIETFSLDGGPNGIIGNNAEEATFIFESGSFDEGILPGVFTLGIDSALLEVEKTGPGTITPGDTLTYTITVTNQGPVTAEAVVAEDDIVPGSPDITFVSNSGDCTTPFPCDLGDIPGGSTLPETQRTRTITSTFRVAPDYGGPSTITNTATITSTTDPEPRTSTVTTDVTENPVIGVAKTIGAITPLSGGRFRVTYDIAVENLGNVNLSNVELTENLNDTFDPGTFSTTSVTSSELTTNNNYNGTTNTNLLASGNTLEVAQTAEVQLVIEVTPSDLSQEYTNQVQGTGTSPAGETVTDDSDNGFPSDPDGDGNPNEPGENDPTPLNFNNLPDNPVIGVAKGVSSIIRLGDNRFRITYDLLVENLGNVNLNDVELTENLDDTFGAGTFTVTSVTSPTLTTNQIYDGSNNINLLAPGNTLAVGRTAEVRLVIDVTPPNINQDYTNQVEATGTSPDGVPVNDLSDNGVPTEPDGLETDPNNDGNPNQPGENDPTPVNFSNVTESPGIGVAKSVGSIEPLDQDTFRVTYNIGVENLGNVSLSNVELNENLDATFGAGNFTVNSISSPTLTTNADYNGSTDRNLLAPGNTLNVDQTVDLTLVVDVTPPDLNDDYTNQIQGTGTSPSGAPVEDFSDNGFPSDPDGDGNANEPGENDPTPVNFSGQFPAIGVAKNATSTTPLGAGRFLVTYDLLVANVGEVPLSDVKLLENLNDTFGAGNFTVVNVTSPTLTLNPNYNGNNVTNLLGTGNNLNVGESATMQLVVDVTPPDLNREYNNQVQATGLSPNGTSVNDFSDNGVPTDPDSLNPNPDGGNNANGPEENNPTPVTFTNTPENPGIGVAKSAGTVQDNGDGTFTIPYTIVVENLGNTTLTNVQVTDNLFGNNRSAFAGTQNVRIDDDPIVTGALSQPNLSFDGNRDQNLLSGTESLSPNQTATITLNVIITPGNNLGPFENSAVGQGNRNGRIVSDASIPGSNPDPNGDGNPGNDNQPTVVSFGEPNLRLVKRITDVLRNGESLSEVNLNRVIDDQNDPDDNVSGWSALPNGLLGVINLGSEVSLQSGDEVEYTIYFLSDGGPVVNDVQICDAIPEQTTFVPNTIELNETSLTDNEDADQGIFFSELTPVTPPCPNPDNPNGSVLVNVGDVPSTPPNNVGFVRFRVTID
ncbi:MAG: hypothetical protein RIG63_27835 [Coleofasciculus chthonoplastes F3-SA18-01]|uniref:DUF7507 domain-containing protein n=1 Tax=Coleofasciculus chthonoplastes TaxID=64178 RepID=UPI0032F19522